MKQLIRSRLARSASFMEVCISVLILIGTAISCIALLFHVSDIIVAFSSTISSRDTFDAFLAFGIQLIIAVEFVKMLAKHTPGSTIEVLLIVIAKRVVVDKLTMFDILMGVIAIAVLFLIKKYLFTSDKGYSFSGETVFNANTQVNEFNKITGANIPSDLGESLEDVLLNEFDRAYRKVKVHETLKIGNVTFAINEIREGRIAKVEVIFDKDK